MKEALVEKDLSVQIHDVPIPKPGRGEVLIKILYSGCNPKDWKYPAYLVGVCNPGDDMAGTIVEVGEDVTEFRTGDRVAAMHVMGEPHGSFAEYGIAPAATTFLIPSKTSLQEAATIPLAALTAAVVLYRDLELPPPWSPAQKPLALIVYGASSAVGAFAVKFALKSNIHPIIAIAGKSKKLFQDLIDPSKGDIIFDYRDGEESLSKNLQAHLQKFSLQRIEYGFDTIGSPTSAELVARLIQPGGHLNIISPRRDCSRIPTHVKTSAAFVGVVHGQDPPDNDTIRHVVTGSGEDFGFIFSRLFTRGLSEGWLTGHPYEVWPNGLSDISEGLRNLQNGLISGKKYVFKIV